MAAAKEPLLSGSSGSQARHLQAPTSGAKEGVDDDSDESSQDLSMQKGSQLAKLRMQVITACCIMFAEGYYATHLFPFVSFMAEDMRGSDDNLGTYAGLISTTISLGMLASSYHWAQASNRFGRKACLLIGLFCSALSSGLVMLSTDYWTVVIIRLFQGIMNSNLGIVRTSLREAHQRADEDDTSAFSMLSVAFGASSIAGPSVGGLIYDRCPEGPFAGYCKPWTTPFFVCFILYALALVITAVSMEETADFNETRGLIQSPTSKRTASRGGLMTKAPFLLLLVMGGGHSYVFTGWELAYPLFARVKKEHAGQGWVTSQIGVTFLVGSIFLVFNSMAIYPKLVKKLSPLSMWIWSWCLPVIMLPVFPRAVTMGCLSGMSDLMIAILNYSMQIVMSVFLGGNFIGIQLLLNSYVSEQPNGAVLLQVANSGLVSTQALVRTVSPLSTGKLFELGLAADKTNSFREDNLVTRALAFDHLSLVGIICCIICGVLFRRTR